MHDPVAMLIMIPSDWHQNSAVPEIADDEVSAMTAYRTRRSSNRSGIEVSTKPA